MRFAEASGSDWPRDDTAVYSAGTAPVVVGTGAISGAPAEAEGHMLGKLWWVRESCVLELDSDIRRFLR